MNSLSLVNTITQVELQAHYKSTTLWEHSRVQLIERSQTLRIKRNFVLHVTAKYSPNFEYLTWVQCFRGAEKYNFSSSVTTYLKKNNYYTTPNNYTDRFSELPTTIWKLVGWASIHFGVCINWKEFQNTNYLIELVVHILNCLSEHRVINLPLYSDQDMAIIESMQV